MNQYKSKHRGIIVLVVAILLIWGVGYIGLKVLYYSNPGVAFGGPTSYKPAEPRYDWVFHVEPQVIYRLDEHRYLELENYESCDSTVEDRGYARVYYYDTQRGIKTRISPKVRNFIGRIINADPTGKNIAFAGAPEEFFASNYGNGRLWVIYSTDYGRTFEISYFNSSYSRYPIMESEEYAVVITDKELFIYDKQYFSGSSVDIFDLTIKNEQGKYIRRSEQDAFVPDYPGLMDHYECDRKIKGELELIPIAEYEQKYGGKDD